MDELRGAGFRAILSLHDGGVDLADTRRREFAHKLLPLPDSVPPSPQDILAYERLLLQALSFISQHVINEIPTLVHCHASRDRTGVVMACYLSTYMGTKPSQAIETLRAIKADLLSAEGYEALVHHLSGARLS